MIAYNYNKSEAAIRCCFI